MNLAFNIDPKRGEKLAEFQNKIGYTFKKLELLDESLTHDSLRVASATCPTYQRLEWLGDAILHFLVSKHLFRKHSDYNEGRLSDERAKLVEANAQKKVAIQLKLENYVLFAPGVEKNKDNFKGIDNFVESVIGAIFIDAGKNGEEEVRKFINKYWKIQIESTDYGWFRSIFAALKL